MILIKLHQLNALLFPNLNRLMCSRGPLFLIGSFSESTCQGTAPKVTVCQLLSHYSSFIECSVMFLVGRLCKRTEEFLKSSSKSVHHLKLYADDPLKEPSISTAQLTSLITKETLSPLRIKSNKKLLCGYRT